MSEPTVALHLPDEFAGADNAVIVVENAPRFTIDDVDTVEIFVAALGPLTGGWEAPSMGVPITRVRVDLFDGDDAVGSVGVSMDWITAQVRGTFVAHKSSESIGEALLAVFDKAWLLHGSARLVAPPLD